MPSDRNRIAKLLLWTPESFPFQDDDPLQTRRQYSMLSARRQLDLSRRRMSVESRIDGHAKAGGACGYATTAVVQLEAVSKPTFIVAASAKTQSFSAHVGTAAEVPLARTVQGPTVMLIGSIVLGR